MNDVDVKSPAVAGDDSEVSPPAHHIQSSDNSSGYADADNRYTSMTSYDEARVFNSQRGVERQRNPYTQESLNDYKSRMLA